MVASRFLRFPGGCYVEGVTMRNGFFWKPSVGPVAERPGHWNGMWQYWSTDGGSLAPAWDLCTLSCLDAMTVWWSQRLAGFLTDT